MNTKDLKAYAPKARRDFIAAVTKQAQKYGVTETVIHPVEINGDVCVVNGKPFPANLAQKINKLGERVKNNGFEQTMEQVAYSWFNRLIAIRYMELHDYLGHGRRVLSHPEHATGFQILEECTELTYGNSGEVGELPDLTHERVVELKLDGTKDEELYRELLLAQCHALHKAMPFLFETIDDETELLLPENLTKTDSLIHDLITDLAESDWESIEVVGWLYQFYISEKKDEVIGKVVTSEDIPAATQLFTPNWIVKYMVQNSLGAQWLATYPESPLKAEMEYYIEPAEQTDEVNAQLKAITPESLNPEELTLIDPASGSGHILVEAYDLFKAIYLERGYRQRDIAKHILEKNLFGLDIDQRAAQLTGFALMMKGCEDDRRLFERGVKLNVMAMVDSTTLDVDTLIHSIDLRHYGLQFKDIAELKDIFEHATTFGSLIQLREGLVDKLPVLKELIEADSQDLFVSDAFMSLSSLVRQAELLTAQYDAVVANPPYMGRKGMNAQVKKFAGTYFPDSKSDLFSCFIERSYSLAKVTGHSSLVTMQSWMFLSSFAKLRERLLQEKTIIALAQIGYNSFPSLNSKVAQAAVFSFVNYRIEKFAAVFNNLNDAPQSADKNAVFLAQDPANRYDFVVDQFKRIPGSPIAYWVGEHVGNIFQKRASIGRVAELREGIHTGQNHAFVRAWTEINAGAICFNAKEDSDVDGDEKTYVPYNKGGVFRLWYGNNEYVLAWNNPNRTNMKKLEGHVRPSQHLYFKSGIEWSLISSSNFGVRHFPAGVLNDVASHYFVSPDENLTRESLGLLASKVCVYFLRLLNPTLNFSSGVVAKLPFVPLGAISNSNLVISCVNLSKKDWDAYERSWDFQSLAILTASTDLAATLESNYIAWITQNRDTIAEMKCLEEQNNRLFIDAYGLMEELIPDVPIEQITLTVNPAYRYGIKKIEEERNTRFREDTMEELASYAIGCMMGRYSLDEPGLIYANSGNEGFDASRYTKFSADDDGIIPLTDKEWFADDAVNRLVEFISVAWDKAHLEENLNFLSANLSPKKGEDSRDTLRRYLCDKFYKDHMQTYKKRPIYWLFSSGKQKAFQCLVYLHRYNESTLARMRTEYVIPLTVKLSSHIEKLENDKGASGSAAEIKKLEKEIKNLHKQQTELTEFDEKLKHYADMRIPLDLDDGVKVNYGKFGDLLAEVKAIHGKAV
jgi:type II restriction/modification system DNA methylase subunit YeeA